MLSVCRSTASASGFLLRSPRRWKSAAD